MMQGEILWRLAHTAMATSWTTMINQKREYDACAGVQLVLSSLLSQIYAALSRVRLPKPDSHGKIANKKFPDIEPNDENDQPDVLRVEYALGPILRYVRICHQRRHPTTTRK
jgi:hypothetical protein